MELRLYDFSEIAKAVRKEENTLINPSWMFPGSKQYSAFEKFLRPNPFLLKDLFPEDREYWKQ
jgi:hypothetical protein